jgi:hypothetical protein
VEIARVLDLLAHPCDTTPERRSPGHLAMTGAPVQLAVVLLEERPNGSAVGAVLGLESAGSWRIEGVDVVHRLVGNEPA